MENFAPAKLGSGKAVHAMFVTDNSLRGAMVGGCTGGDTVVCEDASTAITCKRCLNTLPSWDTTTDHSTPEAPAREAGQAIAAKKIAAKLRPAMVTALVGFHRDGDWGNTRVGTKVALLDRDLVGHSRKGINPDLITELGYAVLAELGTK